MCVKRKKCDELDDNNSKDQQNEIGTNCALQSGGGEEEEDDQHSIAFPQHTDQFVLVSEYKR